jgi:hypothetical protein
MRAFVDDALALGWTLIPYETAERPSTVNAREEDQARNLAAALPESRLLVWCGNHHLLKVSVGDWTPMGSCFRALTGIEPFCIDQTPTIRDTELAECLRDELERLGGTAGELVRARDVDARIYSLDNLVR